MNDDVDAAPFSEMFPSCLDSSSSSAPVLSKLQASATVANEPKKRRRMRKESSKKRKLMEEQAEMLERSFVLDRKLETERKDRLAAELGLDPNQVAVWFQNRRVRWKTKKLQDEFSILRSQYDAVRLHNCRLESQVLKLKVEVNEAKKEIEKLLSTEMLMRCKNSSPTPSSSLTIDTNAPAVDPVLLLHMHAGDFDFHATADFHFEDHIPAFGFDLWNM